MEPKPPPMPTASPEIIDWSNPCDRAKALRSAYFERLAGGTSVKVRFKADGNEQEYHSAMTGASLAELRKAMEAAEDECRIACGQRPLRGRFSIVGGSRSRIRRC